MAHNYWIEITGRRDIGTDLRAPAGDKDGKPNWSYDAIQQVGSGDVVFHYSSRERAIVGRSRAVGQPWLDQIYWAARGTRSRGIAPHLQPGWYLALEGYTPFDRPLSADELTERRVELFALRDAIQSRSSKALAFPFILYRPDEVRAFQAYLTRFPAEMLEMFPQLREGRLAEPLPIELGGTYRVADEATSVGLRDPFDIDPGVVERALRGHAVTQNALARFVASIPAEPLSPVGDTPMFDLAWQVGCSTFVAEVKSRTDANEERQLRLGLGQVLRYAQCLREKHSIVKPVLVLESEPVDLTWKDLCASVGVHLCWAPSFEGL
ncbi:hypothetical protein [Phenylobacterium sp.]|jgi:hypothetical protein|uniref:hypothetical protein n=1 Tax=Phenylobacterium sp. TaxID=1871053 RepID=UPI002F92E620